MLKQKIATLALGLYLSALGTVVSCAEARASDLMAPSLTVDLSFSAKERFPLKNLELAIHEPGGRTTWRYAADGKIEADVLMKQANVLATDWYTTPGKYSLSVSYLLEGNDREVKQEEQEFLVSGEELRVTAKLWFNDDEEKHRAFLANLTLVRLLSSTGSVFLIQDWTPSPEARPRYQIINSTNRPIYGVDWLGNFFGKVRHEVRGQWMPYPRGGFCGTVEGGTPIGPSERAGSIEGYFIGDAKPFVNGKFKYVVQYSLSSPREAVPTDLMNNGKTRKRAQEIYEVSAEFYVTSNE
jgi:hypothetical protein